MFKLPMYHYNVVASHEDNGAVSSIVSLKIVVNQFNFFYFYIINPFVS